VEFPLYPAVLGFYYLDNFQRVLDWIAQRYADLLDDEEQAFIAAFRRPCPVHRAPCSCAW
jgi:hypothetical protein